MPTFKSAYKKKPSQRQLFVNPTMTKQSHKNECDINQIMAKFQRTGIITHGHQNEPLYGEIPSEDFHQAMNIISDSNSMFETLPSSLRKRFHNDPQKYLEFVENPENRKEMEKMGLSNPPKSPPTNQTEIKPDQKEAPPSSESTKQD